MDNISGEICIFCLYHRSRNNVCTYGLQHEYPNDQENKIPPKQVKKQSPLICLKCKLHQKNPLSATNNCSHEYLVE